MGRKKKQRSKAAKIMLWIASILMISILAIGGYGVYYVNSLLNKVEKVEIEEENLSIDVEKEEEYGEIRNIALFGVDAVEGRKGRSDAIMILTLDTKHNKIKLTSIMRDSYVNIDKYGMDKINHAYAFGGPELAVKTLNENFGLNIKDFMTVNFSSMPKIIDKLGGVSIDITNEEAPHISGISGAGKYNLTGAQALQYSRIRYASGGDYKRTERQRNVINGLFEKVTNISVSKYPGLISDFLPFVSTNMSSGELLNIGKDFAILLNNGLIQSRYPLDGDCAGKTINGVYYLTFDLEQAKQKIHDYIFEDKK